MLNQIWLALVLLAVAVGGFQGQMQAVTDGAISSAKTAVDLAIGLVGVMTLWLGVMRLAERSGLVQILARGLRPVMRWLFPEVPPDHPAMGAMMMNMAANMLGIGNAATPLGLRAMTLLEKLNPRPGTATNAMCTFLAINTSSIQLIPATSVALLSAAKSTNPSAIIGTSFLATTIATCVAIVSVKIFEKLPGFALPPVDPVAASSPDADSTTDTESSANQPKPMPAWGPVVLLALAAIGAFAFYQTAFGMGAGVGKPMPTRVVEGISAIAIPMLLGFFPLYAALRGLKVYEEFVEGAKEGFNVAIRIIPYLVTMLVAIGMFRGAGCIKMLTDTLGPALSAVGFPPDLFPLTIMRPLSGSGSQAIVADIIKTFGPDALVTRMAATIFGSTETTFYVLAVYFGSVSVRKTRHAIPVGLIADLAGVIASVAICRLVFG